MTTFRLMVDVEDHEGVEAELWMGQVFDDGVCEIETHDGRVVTLDQKAAIKLGIALLSSSAFQQVA